MFFVPAGEIEIEVNFFDIHIFFYFSPVTQSSIIITLKWVSKRSSFRYWFQEHLLKFLMLAVTDSD
jgi:hypothetical protein